MNAARPTFSLAFSAASLAPTPTDGAAPAKSGAKSRKSKIKAALPAPTEAASDEYSACLSQARICREQAQEAVRLRRFRAAVGLFQTAISLCQRAVSLRKNATPPAASSGSAGVHEGAVNDGEAREYLQVLATELSTYDELMRSLNRPLLENGH